MPALKNGSPPLFHYLQNPQALHACMSSATFGRGLVLDSSCSARYQNSGLSTWETSTVSGVIGWSILGVLLRAIYNHITIIIQLLLRGGSTEVIGIGTLSLNTKPLNPKPYTLNAKPRIPELLGLVIHVWGFSKIRRAWLRDRWQIWKVQTTKFTSY